MQVILVTYTANIGLAIANTVWASASALADKQSWNKLSAERKNKLLKHLIISDYTSLLKYVIFTFNIGSISRIISHQLIHHCLVGYAQQKQRYISIKERRYITPPTIFGRSDFLTKYEQTERCSPFVKV